MRARPEYPGETDEAHPQAFVTIPPQPTSHKSGQLSPDQIQHYFQKGYLLVDKFFTREELDPCRDATDELVEELAQQLYKAGKVKDLYREHGFSDRLTKLEADFPGASILLIRKGKLPQAYKELWSNPRLLNVVEQLLGQNDIVGHPMWNLRTKTPHNEELTVPWHQDVAYLDGASYKVLIATAWIPLLNTSINNGCMQVLSGGHRTGRIVRHTCCAGETWYVEMSESDMEETLEADMSKDVVTCEVPYGGMLLINNLIPHRSMENYSDEIRYTLDLRFLREQDPVGFFGLTEGIKLRSSTDPDMRIDWDSFTGDQRPQEAKEETTGHDPFSTLVTGSYMRRWEITHTNRHVEALQQGAGADVFMQKFAGSGQ